MTASPQSVVRKWVDAFNAADIGQLMSCYHRDAVNHQVAYEPMHGRDAIRQMFEVEFGRAKMVCNIENLFEDGEWAILEWIDPLGLRGCGFFLIRDGLIVFQRGYFDRLKFFEVQGLPIAEAIEAMKS